MWGQVYAEGDKYSRKKAVDGLERILPDDKTGAHEGARAAVRHDAARTSSTQLIAELFKGVPT